VRRLARSLLFAIAAVAGVLAGGAATRPAAGAELVMFESAGCPYCARWHRDIGPIYSKTEEGRRAPLRRVDLSASRSADLSVLRDVVYTPTFVLMQDGREVGRIVGYIGDEAFWALLGELVVRLDRGKESRPSTPPLARASR
jgi:hypothetical protein